LHQLTFGFSQRDSPELQASRSSAPCNCTRLCKNEIENQGREAEPAFQRFPLSFHFVSPVKMNSAPPPITTSAPQALPATSIEAKLVVLGAQGAGKTSLVSRFINPAAPLSQNVQSTIGASFVTKRITDPDTSTTVRLQIWDTAGQERFRSLSRLYYRGANAGVLCYDITSEKSWEEMKTWLAEMKAYCEDGDPMPIIHVVGTKSDLVTEDPSRREVTFERTIAYMAEQLGGILAQSTASTPPLTMKPGTVGIQSPDSKRSSGFWNQDIGWDSCHEVNAKDGEGIEEVFRVIARKLIEQRHQKDAAELARLQQTPGYRSENGEDYFGVPSGHAGSFRVGYGDKRRSWLGLPSVSGLGIGDSEGGGSGFGTRDPDEARRRGRCC
jgi:small GTP-binding protein